MLRMNKLYKRIIALACLVCCMCAIVPTGVFAGKTKKNNNNKKKSTVSVKKYYPDAQNKDKYFKYYIIEDAYIEDYYGVVITDLSDNYGKKLEVPGKFGGVVIKDVILSDFHTIEEVKLADSIETITCTFAEASTNGKDGQYMDCWNATPDPNCDCESEDICESLYKYFPECSIKKLTVGKNFMPEYLEPVISLAEYASNGYVYNLWNKDGYRSDWRSVSMENLEEIVAPEDAYFLSVHDNIVYSKDGEKLLYIPKKLKENMTTFTAPKGCKIIGGGTFAGAKNLKSIDLGESVEIVEDAAFASCEQLEELDLGDTLEQIKMNAFQDCAIGGEVVFPKTLKLIEEVAFAYTQIESIVFPKDVQTEIQGYVFMGNNKLKSVVLPDSMTRIPESLFAKCTSLEEVNIPANVTRIDYEAFYNCQSLKEISMPDNVKKIEWNAFRGCSGLTDIQLSKELKTIGEGAFMDCTGLTQIVIPEKVKEVLEGAFNNCPNLTKLVVQGKDTLIWDECLASNENLVIYGPKSSDAQDFAEEYDVKFVVLE